MEVTSLVLTHFKGDEAMPLKETESSHWYAPDGSPCHRWKGKPTTLWTARKLQREEGIGLLPSVTNLLGSLAKPALTRWFVEQGIIATIKQLETMGFLNAKGKKQLQQVLDETPSGTRFKQEAFDLSRERSGTATNFGSRWHAMAEAVALDRKPKLDDELKPYLPFFVRWFNDNVEDVERVEHVLVDKETGYAGTCDGVFRMNDGERLMVLDYKTSGKPTDKLRAWDDHCWQLASYRHAVQQAYPDEEIGCMNVLVSSLEPGEPVVHVWSEEKLAVGWEIFRKTAEIWQLQKGYKP